MLPGCEYVIGQDVKAFEEGYVIRSHSSAGRGTLDFIRDGESALSQCLVVS